jgi:hypothetical protein
MVNIVYPLLIFVFVFGAATTFINTSGLYQHQLPNSGLAANTSQPSDFNSAIQGATSNQAAYSFQTIFLLGQVIAGGITAIITLGPLLISYGVPASMTVFLISPIGFVVVFWIIELIFGRFIE